MARSNTDTFNLGVFTGAGQKAAHEVLANLYCKHVDLNADQKMILNDLESDTNFDREAYKHLLSETGAQICLEHEQMRNTYIELTLVKEPLVEMKNFAKQYAHSPIKLLSENYTDAKRRVDKISKDINDCREILDITERDILDFNNACMSLEGERRIVGAFVTARLHKQYDTLKRMLENTAPKILKLPGPETS